MRSVADRGRDAVQMTLDDSGARGMEPRDVERIIRDVLTDLGVRFSGLLVEPTAGGWHASLTDPAGRRIVITLPDGPPAAIRTALTQWVHTEP